MRKHRGKPVLFAVNHRSNIDGFVAFFAFSNRSLFFIGKESLFKPHTFTNWFLRSVRVFPLRTGNELAVIRHSLNILKSGKTLVIYPEGRRNFNAEDALELKGGTAMIAMKSGVPVIPVVTNRKAKPFCLTTFKIGKTIYPNEFENKLDFSNALTGQMRELLDGFEKQPRLKKWEKRAADNVRAILLKDGKIAAIKREKNGETFFTLPGGHVDANENPRDAAVRELREETNLESDCVRLLYKSLYHNKSTGKDVMQSYYVCRYKTGELGKTDAEEYNSSPDDVRHFGSYEPCWIDIDAIPKVDLRPKSVAEQLVKDIKKKGEHLVRPTKFIKSRNK
jgi:1-acyl-sn-glycerol-3-phosphate acyltransferase